MREQLLALLERRSNHRGLALAHESVLVEQLKASPKDLRAAIDELVRAEEIRIVSPLPFLVARATGSWPGSRQPHFVEEQPNSSETAPALDVPVSSSIAAATNSNGDRGAGKGTNLLDEVLAVLGPEADREEFRRILAAHHPSRIHRALRRVEATKQIRVSKAALFRALLQRLSH